MDNIPKKWYRTWWGTIMIIVAFLILIFISVFGFYVLDLAKKIKSGELQTQTIKQAELTPEKKKLIEGLGNYSIGTSSPVITIVYFADFACPLCKNAFNKIREISLVHKDKIQIIYRDFPIHDESIDLAMGARCAGEQGLFWPMHDKLFQNQGVAAKEEISALAKQVGVDSKKYESCITAQKFLPQIQKDYSDGETLGIAGTPTWFINGAMVSGDIPSDNLNKIIQELLK